MEFETIRNLILKRSDKGVFSCYNESEEKRTKGENMKQKMRRIQHILFTLHNSIKQKNENEQRIKRMEFQSLQLLHPNSAGNCVFSHESLFYAMQTKDKQTYIHQLQQYKVILQDKTNEKILLEMLQKQRPDWILETKRILKK